MNLIETTLGLVAEAIQTGPFGSQLHSSDYSEEGTPVIMPQDIVDWKISEDKIARVNGENVTRLKRHKCQLGDIIYPRRGDLAKCAFITSRELGWLCGTGCLKVTVDESKAIPKYVYFHLQQPYSINCIETATVGSTMPNLNTSILSKVKLRLPSLNVQKKVVEVLSEYDRLVELNKRKIEILEEMAMRTYREWFVHFRFPHHESCEFVNGLPKGWKFASISNLIENYIGGGWGEESQSRDFSVGGYVIRGSDIPNILNGIPNKEVFRYHTPSNIASRELSEGDIIFEISGGSDNQSLGRNCLITKNLLKAYGDKVICASFCKRLIPQRDYSEYLFGYLHQLWSVGALDTFSVRITGISNFKFEAFLKYHNLLIPPKEIAIKYSEIVNPIYNEVCNIGNSIDKLQKMRDHLLPQLMSGLLEI